MAQLTQKLMRRFRAVSPTGLSETAKECLDAADRYRACADELAAASRCFEAGNFEAGYARLQKAEAALSKK